jgi:hypothetical protein
VYRFHSLCARKEKTIVNRTLTCVVALIALSCLDACRTAELTGTGAKVVVARSAPAEYGYQNGKCTVVGHVVGQGGGALGGAWISNDKLIEYALNDARNQAAAKGANFIQHDAPSLAYSGDKNGVSATSATVNGTAFKCSGAGVVAPTAGESALPEGAAGFRFKETIAEAEQACTSAGFEWHVDGGDASCSGQPARSGIDGLSKVQLCSGAVCGITVLGTPGAAGETMLAYRTLETALTAKYGRPRQGYALPTDCKGKETDCLASGRGEMRRAWTWETKHVIELSIVKVTSDTFRCRLVYATPEWARAAEKGPALLAASGDAASTRTGGEGRCPPFEMRGDPLSHTFASLSAVVTWIAGNQLSGSITPTKAEARQDGRAGRPARLRSRSDPRS